MTVVEKVARAICQADEQNGGAPWDWYGSDKSRSGYFDSARSVLAALHDSFADPVVRAAIQAALDEKEAG